MNLIKKLFFTLLGVAASMSVCLAQDEVPPPAAVGEYFFLGFEMPLFRVKDRANSPQAFEGYGYKISFGYEKIKQRFISRFKGSYTFGSGSPKTRPKSKSLTSVRLNDFDFSYSYYQNLQNIPDAEANNFVKQGTYVGGSIHFLADMRQYSLPSNNVIGFQSNLSLHGGVWVRQNMNKNWRFNYEATTPLMALTLRPSYIGLPIMRDTFDVSPRNILKAICIATIPKFVGFQNTFSFDQQINDYRARRISYDWFVLSNSRGKKPVIMSGGGLGYQSLFKL